MKTPEIAPGDVLSYAELCVAERSHLQRGMNFRLRGGPSVVLMSVQPNAPYADALEDEGRTLIYEGHNAPSPPSVKTPNGRINQLILRRDD